MPSDPDHYQEYYAYKLWGLIPPIYRQEDTDNFLAHGPLWEIVSRIAAQCAVLRRSIDRLHEDGSIETCDDWVIAYFADLLKTRLVASMDARGQRLDVANTIYYRRRKGTLALVEELAANVTGWEVKAVEFFRRMARSRHNLDPVLGLWQAPESDAGRFQRAEGLFGSWTRTGIGGYADIRNVYGAGKTGEAFGEFFYTSDVRRPRGHEGWPNIPNLGVFLWRLKSFGVIWCDPVEASNRPGHFTFDPTGREIPLFNADAESRAFGDAWVSPQEWQLPGHLTTLLLDIALSTPDMPLWAATDPDTSLTRSNSLGVATPGPTGFVVHPAEHTYALRNKATGDPQALVVTPERGCFYYVTAPPASVFSTYHYGFASEIGAGPYDRRQAASAAFLGPANVTGGGDALASQLAKVKPSDTIVIGDSRTYNVTRDIVVGKSVSLLGGNEQRPLVRQAANGAWTFTGKPSSTLLLDGLFISGGDIILEGDFDEVVIRCCTFDPGSWNVSEAKFREAVDGRTLAPSHLFINGNVRSMIIERAILGPIVQKSGALTQISLTDSVVQSWGGELSLDLSTGEVSLERITLLGPAKIHRLYASNSIFDDKVVVEDSQHGCVRFSAWANGSVIPSPYESLKIDPGAFLFVSRDFGRPEYCQLHQGVDFAIRGGAQKRTISAGAEDGSEMGVFCREKGPVRERSLFVKFQEFLPVAQVPVLIYAT